jgi:hypothetical protein
VMLYPLALWRGDSYHWAFRFWNDPAKTDPYDLTGCTAAAEIRTAPGVEPATAMACVITGNVIDVRLSVDDCRALPAAGTWDLQLTKGTDVTTVVVGPVAVNGDITGSGATP